jgi:hypothetical protein
MYEVTLAPLSNRETFVRSFQALDSAGDAIDLTGATIVFEARSTKSSGAALSATTANGKCVISTTTFTVTFAVSETSTLCEKEYAVGCTIDIDDVVTQLFVGKLPIIDGIVS